MTYKEQRQNLFDVSKDYYLVQCISADFAMGKGIALEFNKHFDMKNKIRRKYPINHWQGKGFCIVESKVLNLVTKQYYYKKPTYDTLTDALIGMKNFCVKFHVKKIAMPMIGCGLDKLEWDKVSKIIQDIFLDTNVEILVCKY